MYTVTQIEKKGLSFLEVKSPDGLSSAEICLTQGGRLSDLVFKGVQVLADYDSSTYQDNYASAILFPFVNRIRNGTYTYEGIEYQLDCNETDMNNALHGLVYNKEFSFTNKTLASNYATIILKYKHDGHTKGFPFKFNIELAYTLNTKGINLSTKVKNRDKQKFPFSLGWHPYFNSINLDKSYIYFEGKEHYILDNQKIVVGTKQMDFKMPFLLNGIELDDGFSLHTSEVILSNPNYNLNLTSSLEKNYLQLYKPAQSGSIAIEPMTGVADSFNNKIGLQSLLPNETFKVDWNLNIEIPSKKGTN